MSGVKLETHHPALMLTGSLYQLSTGHGHDEHHSHEHHAHGHDHSEKTKTEDDDMPAWKKRALEAGNDPSAAPFGGNWHAESSLSAKGDNTKMEE